VNSVHDTENEIIERRTKSEINSMNCDDKEINNNNHSFYLPNAEDKRDKNDNETHKKILSMNFSRNDDVVVLRTHRGDKIENQNLIRMEIQHQLDEPEILLIDKNDNISDELETRDQIRKSDSSLIEIDDEKEISVQTTDASDDSEILEIESNVSAVNHSITSSSQISNDTSTSKTTTTIPLLIGESFFSCIQLLLVGFCSCS
jgi:hypothetical protein